MCELRVLIFLTLGWFKLLLWRKHVLCIDFVPIFSFINVFRGNIVYKDKCNVIPSKYSTGREKKIFTGVKILKLILILYNFILARQLNQNLVLIEISGVTVCCKLVYFGLYNVPGTLVTGIEFLTQDLSDSVNLRDFYAPLSFLSYYFFDMNPSGFFEYWNWY